MKNLEKELYYWLEQNQFKDGNFKGQFGTNTNYAGRSKYHHEDENIYITPHMFMTYFGTLCMLNKKEKYSKNIELILSFLDLTFEKGMVLYPHSSLTSQNIDPFHEDMKILYSYRHTAMGLNIYLVLDKNFKLIIEKIKGFIDKEIQNKDGGWPLSNEVYINSDLTTSVYIANLFENFLGSKITNHDLEKEMDNMQYYTLDFLNKEFENQYKNNFERMLMTIPSFYFLGFSSFIKYNSPLLYKIPDLILEELLDKEGWIKVNNPKKIHRYSIRYCNCLFLASFIDSSYYSSYKKIRSNVIDNLNFSELNTFEIFTVLNFIKDNRIKKDNIIKVIDSALPIFNLTPLGAVIYSYLERKKGKPSEL